MLSERGEKQISNIRGKIIGDDASVAYFELVEYKWMMLNCRNAILNALRLKKDTSLTL